MHQIPDIYKTVIFDCDGVLLDSNQLKLDSMELALRSFGVGDLELFKCVDYFKSNFGKSRYHHVDHFLESILQITDNTHADLMRQGILETYAMKCSERYPLAEITPGIDDLLNDLKGDLFVASGTPTSELRTALINADLAKYFRGIYGSPVNKSDNVANIVASAKFPVLMVGDSVSDLEAAEKNHIDFLGYLPLSNVAEEMTLLCKDRGYPIVYNWKAY